MTGVGWCPEDAIYLNHIIPRSQLLVLPSWSWLVDGKGIATKLKNAGLGPANQIKDYGVNLECPKCHYRFDNINMLGEWPGLPCGVKFDPSDTEILQHLAAKSGVGSSKPHRFIDDFIPTLDQEDGICYTHPENLPGAKKDGSSVHFFHKITNAYASGQRKRRKINNQHSSIKEDVRWHKTGKTKPVMENGVQKGFKKIMVLYRISNKGKKPDKSKWVMHQYHLGTNEDEPEEQYVVSKIFYQKKHTENNNTSLTEDINNRNPVSPGTPKTSTPNPPQPEKSVSCDGAIDDYAYKEAEFVRETPHPSSTSSQFKSIVEAGTCSEGNSHATDDNRVKDSTPSNGILSSSCSLLDVGLSNGPLDSFTNTSLKNSSAYTNNFPGLDKNVPCGIADLENLEFDCPLDFQLTDLNFGSQESLLGWFDYI
ncbi:hypothetical protein NMG60_11026644 [Bertholletia excelsa]